MKTNNQSTPVKQVHLIKTYSEESSLFNRYSQYAIYIDVDTLTVKSKEIAAGQQFGGLTYCEEWESWEKVTLPEDQVKLALEKKAKAEAEALYKSRKKRAQEQNEILSTLPMPGNKIEVIKGKLKGTSGVIVRYCKDLYPNAGNYAKNTPYSGMSTNAKAISSYLSEYNTEFIRAEMQAIYGKALMCKDDKGKTFFVKPKYVKVFADNSKSEAEVEAFAKKAIKGPRLANLWSTRY